MFSVSQDEFEKLVDQGIAAIPKRFLEKLNNVAILIEDEPNELQRRQNHIQKDSLLLGLYEGVPQTDRWNYNLALPDKITIFKNPIETLANSPSDIKELVSDTVWHEIAHHYGMDEKRVRAAEKKKGRRNR